jgi:excinuclease ABC subunit A
MTTAARPTDLETLRRRDPNIERRWRETDSAWVREELSSVPVNPPARPATATASSPRRWRSRSAAHRQVPKLSIREANDWFDELPAQLMPARNEIAARILKEIRDRLKFLNDVGLEYLTLSRSSGTLSGGEASASGWPRRSAPA